MKNTNSHLTLWIGQLLNLSLGEICKKASNVHILLGIGIYHRWQIHSVLIWAKKKQLVWKNMVFALKVQKH